MSGIVLNSDGIRLCRQIILEEYRKNPEAVKKVVQILNNDPRAEDNLVNLLIEAAESEWKPEMNCHICGSEEDLKFEPIRLITPDKSNKDGYSYRYVRSLRIFWVLCQRCLNAGWQPIRKITLTDTYVRITEHTYETRYLP